MLPYIEYIELLHNNNPDLLISGLQIVMILFAILAITNNNPVVAILYLIAMFVVAAITLILYQYTFIGYTLIIVYVGAIAILFVFIIMLFQMDNIKSDSEYNHTRNPGLLLLFMLPIITLLLNNNNNEGYNFFLSNWNNNYLNYIFNKLPEINFNNAKEIASVGEIIFSTSPIYLMLTALLLLLGMVGSIHITIKK